MPDVLETTDAAGSTATTYTLSAGQTAQGQLSSSSDHDWYRVDLVAGQTYSFAMTGTGTDNAIDTYLRLYAADGTTLLAQNDDGLPNLNSIFSYTPSTSGTYYIDAANYQGPPGPSGHAGQYGLAVSLGGSRPSFDIQYSSATGAVTVDLSAGTASGGAEVGVDTLANMENVIGGSGSDHITGDAGSNLLDGGGGSDLMTGGPGHDIYVVDNLGDLIIEGVGAGTDTVRTMLSVYNLGANVENLTFTGAGSFAGIGNELANILIGGVGNDSLDGGEGSDTMVGGGGHIRVPGWR